jgi:Glycosyltransferase family 87
MKKPEILILLLALLAMAAKLYCAFTTIGSVDVYYFRQFGQVIADQGVVKMYENPIFNHPPLLGVFLGYAYEWTGPRVALFTTYIRLPGILADLAVVLALLWVRRKTGRPSWWALGLLAASPVSFMVSGYHGNFDPLIALGLTLAVAACIAGQPMLCGAFLGLTCQVKIIPVLLGPAFFFFWLHRGKARPFAIGAISLVLAGWLVPLCTVPSLFLHRVIAYNSIWGWWGFPYLIGMIGGPKLHASLTELPPPAEAALGLMFKALIIAAVITLAWRKRASTPVGVFSTLALSWAVFLVFAPGFGVQYLVWIAPFLLVHSERWFAVYTAAASIALFIFYTAISKGLPWYMGFSVGPTLDQWRPWLLLPWGALIAFLAASISEEGRRRGMTKSE